MRVWTSAALLVVLLFARVAAGQEPPPAASGSRVVLLLDNSGSMRANDPKGLVRDAMAALVATLDSSTTAGLVVFDADARLLSPLESLADPAARTRLVAAAQAVRFDGQHTNIPDGIERALYELKLAPAGERRMIVLVTDGIVDTGDPAKDQEKQRWLRESLLADCRAHGVKILGVAFTEGADYALLQELAQGTGGSYYRALTEADVGGIFQLVQAALAAPPPPPQAPEVRVERVEVPVPVAKPVVPRSLLAVLIAAMSLLGVALVVLWWRSRSSAGNGVPPPEIVLHDLVTGKQHRFSQSLIRVGRRDENELVIPKPTISGHHARLEARGGTFALVDLRSTNGSFVNDQKVERDTILRNGDVLRFDKYKFAFEVPGEMDGDATSMGFAGDRTMVGVPATESTLEQAARPAASLSTEPLREKARDSGATHPELEVSSPGTVGTCPEHPSMFATEKCGKCGRKACYSCIRIVDGKKRCQSCA